MLDERTEQLINRKLDGELTEAESLDLDKRLIRSPEAQAFLDELSRIDGLSAEAIKMATAGCEDDIRRSEGQLAWLPPRQGAWRRLRTGVAIAAVVALAVLAGALTRDRSSWMGSPHGPVAVDRPSENPSLPVQILPPNQDLAAATDSPRMTEPGRELTPRDVIGVYDDETQSVYMLEMGRKPIQVTPVSVNY